MSLEGSVRHTLAFKFEFFITLSGGKETNA
jgi:hypothetical protein